tara:strand:+ start:478 stop:687 length:210 start_codon:yes stop_codon:yes gene_type:complete
LVISSGYRANHDHFLAGGAIATKDLVSFDIDIFFSLSFGSNNEPLYLKKVALLIISCQTFFILAKEKGF